MTLFGIFEGLGIQNSLERTREKIFPVWGFALKLWAPAQMFNYTFIPVHF
jgi:hypothetical protein